MSEKIYSLNELIDFRTLSLTAFTWVVCFGYQIFFYSYYTSTKSGLVTYEPTVFSYYSGIIGDGVLVPLINALVYLLLLKLHTRINSSRIVLALILGLALTVSAHYYQASLALTNWSMPTPFHWSGVGKFHFFFMLAESSFLFYAFVESIVKIKTLLADRYTTGLFGMVWLALSAFAVTFLADYLKVLGL